MPARIGEPVRIKKRNIPVELTIIRKGVVLVLPGGSSDNSRLRCSKVPSLCKSMLSLSTPPSLSGYTFFTAYMRSRISFKPSVYILLSGLFGRQTKISLYGIVDVTKELFQEVTFLHLSNLMMSSQYCISLFSTQLLPSPVCIYTCFCIL